MMCTSFEALCGHSSLSLVQYLPEPTVLPCDMFVYIRKNQNTTQTSHNPTYILYKIQSVYQITSNYFYAHFPTYHVL